MDNYKKRRYRVESKSKDAHFRVDCYENELEYWKDICKHDAKAHNGKCYYRQFPVTKAKKIYFWTINIVDRIVDKISNKDLGIKT